MRPLWSVLLCSHAPCVRGVGSVLFQRVSFTITGCPAGHGGGICQPCPGLWLPNLGMGGACRPRSAWGHDAVHCGASGLSSFPGNLPSSSLAPVEPGKSSKTGWLHYTRIGQRYFYGFPSMNRTQRALICLELCCAARVATNYLARQCKTDFLLKGQGKQ